MVATVSVDPSSSMPGRRGALQRLLSAPGGKVGLAIVLGVILLSISAPWIAPSDPVAMNLSQKLLSPSFEHLMGTDQTGRDVLSRILWGSRASLSIAVLSVLIGVAGGVPLGILAGFFSGTLIDHAVMRAMDVLVSIPTLVWAIAVVGVVGVGDFHVGPFEFGVETKITLLIGILYVPAIARVAYGSALVESRAVYVMARRGQGVSVFRLMFGEVLPNCISPVIVQASLYLAISIVVEASMSFVGLGVQPPTPSWGAMLSDSRGYVFSGEWWLPTFPGVAISVTVIGFNILGDALRDALDPRGRANVLA